MQIKKRNTILIGDHYNTPKTSLVSFHFEPHPIPSSSDKLKTCYVHHVQIENKDLYIFDHFFQKDEQQGTRNYFANASYSRHSYSTPEGFEKGEEPGFSMNTKERWNLFSTPPPTILELHKLLSFLSLHLDAEITTAPWELCHQESDVTPSVMVNYHTQISNQSMVVGKHRDCNPEKGIFFGIPILYQANVELHDNSFENGTPGKPWMVSLLLYATSEKLLPEHKMGTVFYKTDGQTALKTNCLDGRFVLFEGDILHSAEESNIGSKMGLWRISYVLKLIMNPKTAQKSVKKDFYDLLRKTSSFHEINPGVDIRI